MQFQRVALLVLDSVGIGAMPDAAQYGDTGRDTLGILASTETLTCRTWSGSASRTSDRLRG
jgi:phosphopentomutase